MNVATKVLLGELTEENKALKAENEKLKAEVKRLTPKPKPKAEEKDK